MTREFRLGAFVVLALLIFAVGVFWIGRKQFVFHSTYRLAADFDNVAGLNDGAEVRVAGIHEGSVKQIQLPDRTNKKILVVMDMEARTRNVIKKDSVATIQSEGLVGDSYVEVSFGSDQSPKVQNGDTIKGEPPLQISDLLKKTDEILDASKTTVANLNDTTQHFASISGKIDEGQGTIGQLINNKKVYQNMNASAAELREDMEALKHNFFLRGFFKKRGYEDAADLKKNEIPKLPDKPVGKTFDYEAKKIFDKPDSAELKDQKALNDAGSFLQGNQFGLAIVAASSDLKGDTDQDKLLTEARSMVVRDYLVKHFKLADTRIKTIGLGKSDKAADGGSVQILIYPESTTTTGELRSPPMQNR